jgi:hypothetical protein
MTERKVVLVEISGWWHAGTGRGGGEDADAVVAKDRYGLPYLPGRHLKGLLRDACLRLEHWQEIERAEAELKGAAVKPSIPTGTTDLLFGTDEAEADELLIAAGRPARSATRGGRHRTLEGCLAFGNAVLPEALRVALRDPPEAKGPTEQARQRRGLFAYVSATAIDDRGVAKDDTLRRNGVAVPLQLRAEVSWDAGARMPHAGDSGEMLIKATADWPTILESLFPFVRAVGGHRSRGFGRARLSFEEKPTP